MYMNIYKKIYMYSVQCMSKNALFMLIHSVEFDTPLPVGGICMSHQEQRDSDSISHDHCAGKRKEETEMKEKGRKREGGRKEGKERERRGGRKGGKKRERGKERGSEKVREREKRGGEGEREGKRERERERERKRGERGRWRWVCEGRRSSPEQRRLR